MIDRSVEFSEQSNPAVLRASRTETFRAEHRVHESLLAGIEKQALIWMAERVPGWIVPDHLTLVGFVAQLMAGASYAWAATERHWLLVGIVFLSLNWLGDSLDGTLARVRHQERPRYGYYVDHIIDSLGASALMGGLALSGYMHPSLAAGLLIAFLLLSIQSYLATYALGEFRLSFWRFGPTELRILLAAGNLAVLRRPRIWAEQFRLLDVGGVLGLAAMTTMLLFFIGRNARRLYREERI